MRAVAGRSRRLRDRDQAQVPRPCAGRRVRRSRGGRPGWRRWPPRSPGPRGCRSRRCLPRTGRRTRPSHWRPPSRRRLPRPAAPALAVRTVARPGALCHRWCGSCRWRSPRSNAHPGHHRNIGRARSTWLDIQEGNDDKTVLRNAVPRFSQRAHCSTQRRRGTTGRPGHGSGGPGERPCVRSAIYQRRAPVLRITDWQSMTSTSQFSADTQTDEVRQLCSALHPLTEALP